jgi:hypothetical protein
VGDRDEILAREGRMMEPDRDAASNGGSSPLGVGGWIALLVLAGFLVGAALYAAHSWNALAGVPMPLLGWVFMGLGAFFTLLVGGGLMALLFYSSRKGKDF